MLKLVTSVCIEVPIEVVWAQLAKLEDVQLWSEHVVRARCIGEITQGVGAERICDLVGNRSIRERWVAWDEGRSFEYEGFGIPLLQSAGNRWSVAAYGDRTVLTSEAKVVFKGGMLGRVLEPILGPLMRRVAPDTLAAFKYLVEHGQPYRGKASELPKAASICS